MNQNGVIYFTPDSNNTDKTDCGAIVLSDTTLEKQETYKERHKDDFATKSIFGKLWDTFGLAVILVVTLTVLFECIIMNGFIPSESMEPTLMVGDGIVVNRLSYLNDAPERGDVVVFYSDEYNGEKLIKRVIGIPGDVIDIENGSVYVNGCKLVESYACGVTNPSLSEVSHYEVPEDSVFLLGDNREFSADSRWWENPYISYDDIVGKAVFQYSMDWADNGFYARTVESIAPSFVND
jgi:signal peptidase I